MVHVRPLVAGAVGSAALMVGAAAALVGGPAAASQPAAREATLTADFTQVATPSITYQQPYFFGLFSTSRQLSPGDVLNFSDNSCPTTRSGTPTRAASSPISRPAACC